MSREKFEAWGMSDPDLSETLKSEVYASIAWMAWQAASKASEQQLAAVVAENAGLIEQAEEVYAAGYNHGHLNTVDGIAYAPCVKDDFYGLAVGLMREAETPATDAYLGEVRASGVEMFANHIALYNSDSEQHANLFAAQLRQGAAL